MTNDQTTWHPDYGLPTERRLEALRYAETHSVKDAAEVFNVDLSTIYYWRKRMRDNG